MGRDARPSVPPERREQTVQCHLARAPSEYDAAETTEQAQLRTWETPGKGHGTSDVRIAEYVTRFKGDNRPMPTGQSSERLLMRRVGTGGVDSTCQCWPEDFSAVTWADTLSLPVQTRATDLYRKPGHDRIRCTHSLPLVPGGAGLRIDVSRNNGGPGSGTSGPCWRNDHCCPGARSGSGVGDHNRHVWSCPVCRLPLESPKLVRGPTGEFACV